MSVFRNLAGNLCRVLIVLLTVTVVGCGKKEEEGPGERIGKKLDKAVEQAGEAVKDAADKVKKAAEQ